MSKRARIKVEGAKDLQKSLAALAKPAARIRVMRPAIRAAVVPIRVAAKAKAPVMDGFLKKSIASVVKTKIKSGSVIGIIGVRKGEFQRKSKGQVTQTAKPNRYAHLVEFGHGGPRPAPAKPFMRPAFDENVRQANQIMATRARQELAREAMRAAKRGGK